MRRVLIVDDEPAMRLAVQEALTRKGYEVGLASNGREALGALSKASYGMVISDMLMPGMNGMELLREIKKTSPHIPVLLITAFGTIESAVEAVKEGAIDFILKPFTLEALEETVDKAFRTMEAVSDFEAKGSLMLAKGPAMQKVVSMASVAASSDATILISGESGTGKELLARFIHAMSPRRDKAFVAVNCASIPEGLLESELFGHEKGAFTGAHSSRPGKFEQANYGTLLLDEISEMDIKLQAKLLRVIQEKEVDRIGGRGPVPLDIRIIATTNRDMKKEVREARFREDLYYRLNIFPLTLPPLRERAGDIVDLARQFTRTFSSKYSRRVEEISDEALEFMQKQEWRGNIRELQNAIERAVLLSQGTTLEVEHLMADHDMPAEPAGDEASGQEVEERQPLVRDDANLMTLWEMEKGLINSTLGKVDGNRTQAAKILGISVRTLRNKLKEYGEMQSA
ncbi:MAG: sigma-54-dependent Fis family transcriptional regulator [Deltaproteobacteria bacterium]|nr:sigma-54-dependent Fis family transcriptional regulator [Deltaproteobacteria bacterium]